jgi:hypothetical protein
VHTTHRVVVRGVVRGVVCGGGCVVTVRVTTLRGADAGLYYVEHLPNYYLEPGEPPGVWFGNGAAALGLGDVFDPAAFV